MQDNLPELRDIHLPSGDISFFPLAYGWWVLAGVLAAVVLLAWKLLAAARRPDLGSAVRMSEILRRICVYKYKTAAALFGMEWIEFLNRHAKEKISGKTARLLLDAPYISADSKAYDDQDVADLYRFCQNWIGENL